MSESPFDRPLTNHETVVPLRHTFRFAHEPVGVDAGGRYVGRESDIDALAERLLFSEGGSFLVTGYRGVGKTSFINQVIRRLNQARTWAESVEPGTAIRLVHVQLNLARALQPAELMHHIIRQLYETLVENNVMAELPSTMRAELAQAHDRTSFNMTRKMAQSSERNLGMPDVGLEAGWGKLSLKGLVSTKKTSSRNDELSFLGYDDRAAEHDIIRLSKQLARGFNRRDGTAFMGLQKLLRQKPRRIRFKLIFVFDELDKLEDLTSAAPAPNGTDEGAAATHDTVRTSIEELLNSLKTLFTTSGISFVFVAGKDLQERWQEDVGRGDSVYESVFSYHKYLACMWSEIDQLSDEVVDWDALDQAQNVTAAPGQLSATYTRINSPTTLMCSRCTSAVAPFEPFCGTCGQYLLDGRYARMVFEDFKKYLAYSGRGIPRLVIRAFNDHVRWCGTRPVLVISRAAGRRIRFYARLEELLASNAERLFGSVHEEVEGTLLDRRRLAVYYLIDWMLRQASLEFTFAETTQASMRLSKKIAPAVEVAPVVIQRLIDLLVEHDYLLEVSPSPERVLQIGDARQPAASTYRVSPRRLAEMGEEKHSAPPPSPAAGTDGIDATSFPSAPEPPLATPEVRFPNYDIGAVIGRGGMGTVYRAIDLRTGRTVALKMLPQHLTGDQNTIERFRREATILKVLRHRGLVSFYEAGEVDGLLYLAMEFVEGLDLRHVIDIRGALELLPALAIARDVADAAQFVHEHGFVRLDLKPNNILLNRAGNVYITDFGIIRPDSAESGEITGAGMIVGTPAYMSPEQANGSVVDARSDVYALGIVLFEMLAGRPPFQADRLLDVVVAHIQREPPLLSTLATVPAEVEALVSRCLCKDPEERYQSMREVHAELQDILQDAAPTDLTEFMAETVARAVQVNVRENMSTILLEQPRPIHSARPNDTDVPSGGRPRDATLNEPAVALPHPPSRSILLRIVDGPFTAVSEYAFGPDVKTISLGRSSDNDVVLDHKSVSRHHARLELKDEAYFLEDLNSNNGTFLDGGAVRTPTRLRGGERIEIGQLTLEVVLIQ